MQQLSALVLALAFGATSAFLPATVQRSALAVRFSLKLSLSGPTCSTCTILLL